MFLMVLAALLATLVGIPLGFWTAMHAPPWITGLFNSITNVGATLPAFFAVFLLQVVAVELTRLTGKPVVPVFGFGLDGHLVIPVLALALGPLAAVSRLVSLAATELNARDYVRTARAKGLSEVRVVYQHLAPNMVGALGEATLTGLRLILLGLVIVEYLVVWPGLGLLSLRAVVAQDATILVPSALLLGAALLASELGLDLVTRRTGVLTG